MKKILSVFIIGCVFISCEEKEDPKPSSPSSHVLTVNSIPQFSVELDGAEWSLISDSTIIEARYGAFSVAAAWPDSSRAIYSSIIGYKNSNNKLIIQLGEHKYIGNHSSDPEFRNFFQLASYPFISGAIGGVTIYYCDSANTYWTTDQGSGNQTGSVFTIDEIKGVSANDYCVKFKASFNCKLYDIFGNSKMVTNGVYVGYFANL